MSGQHKKAEKSKAKEEIHLLFTAAEKVFRENPQKAQMFVRKARKIAMRYRMRVPQAWKRRYCRKCNAFLTPGINARVRVRNKLVIILCLGCKNFRRVGISHNKK